MQRIKSYLNKETGLYIGYIPFIGISFEIAKDDYEEAQAKGKQELLKFILIWVSSQFVVDESTPVDPSKAKPLPAYKTGRATSPEEYLSILASYLGEDLKDHIYITVDYSSKIFAHVDCPKWDNDNDYWMSKINSCIGRFPFDTFETVETSSDYIVEHVWKRS